MARLIRPTQLEKNTFIRHVAIKMVVLCARREYFYKKVKLGLAHAGWSIQNQGMMMFTPERPPHIRTARASPQRHTAAGAAAPTTADTGNTVPQRANPTQTPYAQPRRMAQAQGQRLGTWTLVRPQKAPSADSTQWYHRKIGTVPEVGLRPGL